MDLGKIKSLLQRCLNHELYRHSLGVADTAASLARRYGVAEEKACLAGLIHDYAKDYSTEKLLETVEKYALKVDPVSLAEPRLLHAPAGAALVADHLDIQDREILDAVAYHTTGCAGMMPLSRIIYLADCIEPNRSYRGVDKLRRLAFQDLDRALLLAVDWTIMSVIRRKILLHPMTIEFRNSLLFAGLKDNGG